MSKIDYTNLRTLRDRTISKNDSISCLFQHIKYDIQLIEAVGVDIFSSKITNEKDFKLALENFRYFSSEVKKSLEELENELPVLSEVPLNMPAGVEEHSE